jgi:hypothetical protein
MGHVLYACSTVSGTGGCFCHVEDLQHMFAFCWCFLIWAFCLPLAIGKEWCADNYRTATLEHIPSDVRVISEVIGLLWAYLLTVQHRAGSVLDHT